MKATEKNESWLRGGNSGRKKEAIRDVYAIGVKGAEN